jgi:DNA-binding CsgD family transcriptional regulator/PAS domain-containing protein
MHLRRLGAGLVGLLWPILADYLLDGCGMSLEAYAQTVASILDAVLDEQLMPTALEAVAEYVGAAGAAYLVVNKLTQQVSSAVWWGCLAGSRAAYFARYSRIDPLREVQTNAPCGIFMRLSECLPQSVLRDDEWYNDFVLKGGVCDILAVKLHESGLHTVTLDLHQAVGDLHAVPRDLKALQSLMPVLTSAGRLYVDRGLRSAITGERLEYPPAGVIFTDGDGRIIETNEEAERILRLSDGLTIRNGQICARRNFETAKLTELIAHATAAPGSDPSIGCLLIGRDGGPPAYTVRVAAVRGRLSSYDVPMAMVLVSAPENQVSESELAELYGLTSAESRLAIAIAFGKRLSEIAGQFGVQITTLRTQLSSILKKCEVERQADLVRLISNIPVVGLTPSEKGFN